MATPSEPDDRAPAAIELRAERYRSALVQIADAESGVWGQIAFEALAADHDAEHPA